MIEVPTDLHLMVTAEQREVVPHRERLIGSEQPFELPSDGEPPGEDDIRQVPGDQLAKLVVKARVPALDLVEPMLHRVRQAPEHHFAHFRVVSPRGRVRHPAALDGHVEIESRGT